MVGTHFVTLDVIRTQEGPRIPAVLQAVGAEGRTARIVLEGLRRHYAVLGGTRICFVLPPELHSCATLACSVAESDGLDMVYDLCAAHERSRWILVSSGRSITNVHVDTIRGLLDKSKADVVLVSVDPALKANREIVRTTLKGEVLGIRRAFFDSIMPDHQPSEWPNHTFISASAVRRVCRSMRLPLDFRSFLSWAIVNGLAVQSLRIGGMAVDLETESGLLQFMAESLASADVHVFRGLISGHEARWVPVDCHVSPSARIYGKVVWGRNVRIEDDAIVAGPVLLCDGATVGTSASIHGAIICPGAVVGAGAAVTGRVYDAAVFADRNDCDGERHRLEVSEADQYHEICVDQAADDGFRSWPRMSYARVGKRICDLVLCIMGLIASLPLFLAAALAVKLTSRGPIFFRHRREGLWGVEFDCLKFRTMISGADSMQDKLRSRNEVDGPQFKVGKDPRVTAVGKFLRDTYIDEIPQFINVLCGQMSMIGPRPSPRSENRLCAYWREARLSVKPGISGLWQVSRSRRSGQDFQEWIHYDIEYVRGMSFRQDMSICIKTIRLVVAAITRRV